MAEDDARRPPLPWLAVAATTGLYLVALATWVAGRPAILGYDLVLVVRAGRRLVEGQALYLDPTGASFIPGSLDLYYGPPALAVLAAPLAWVPDEALRLLAVPLGLGLVAASIALLARSVGLTGRSVAIPALIVGLELSVQVQVALTLGSTALILLLLVAAAGAALARGRLTTMGVLVGIAAALRVYPVALGITLLAMRRRDVIAGAVAGALATTAVGLLAGAPALIEWSRLVVALTGQSGAGDVSADGLLAGAGAPAAVVLAARMGSLALAGAALVGGGLLARDPRPRARLLGWGVALTGMLLAAPVAWDHYGTALIPLALALASLVPAAGLLLALLTATPVGPIAWWFAPLAGLLGARRIGDRRVETGEAP